MPNTLAHMGVGRIASQTLLRNGDDKWIYIGCVIPDIPWIIQRLVTFFDPGIDLLDLRLYVVIQASLFFCLILSAAISVVAQSTRRIFLLLGFNCLLHLLLDACQIKQANGVHLLAPISWQMTAFGFFWPENIISYVLTAIGLILFLGCWQKARRTALPIWALSSPRLIAAAGLLSAYIILPFFLLSGPELADNHFAATLRHRQTRLGRPIAFDRCRYNPHTHTIRIFTGEELTVTGINLPQPVTISVKGRFTAIDRVDLQSFHVHFPFRDIASLVGLALIAVLWFTVGWQRLVMRFPVNGSGESTKHRRKIRPDRPNKEF